jgi:hypothetical protein
VSLFTSSWISWRAWSMMLRRIARYWLAVDRGDHHAVCVSELGASNGPSLLRANTSGGPQAQ